ncbi:integral membrane protein [Streptomyces sp. L-9-10]|uniref:VanZ family protein n=1 Tax=Streptomyces sp. L-9-10 TaxID=1478131 RepID=UPI0010CF4F67|nr:VanZ family protein [Streptomyces sp. L-9-10]RYJ30785.1 integral membrane protein [Streptomyces sp. L-9-10]
MLRILIMTVALVALTGFAAVLAELTLTPSPASAEIAGANLRPGHSLRQYAEDYTFLAACKQIGGNLLMGAPFGLILPVLVPRRLRMVRVVVLTALVMVLVELAQGAVVQGRAFDVDDVILNTSGALIAYVLVGRLIGRRFHALGAVGAQGAPGAGAGSSAGRKSEPGRRPQAKPKGRPVMTKAKPKVRSGATKAKSAAAKAGAKTKRSGSAPGAAWRERLGRLGRR